MHTISYSSVFIYQYVMNAGYSKSISPTNNFTLLKGFNLAYIEIRKIFN